MMCFELSIFEGTSLMHLHKNTKNSVELPVQVLVWAAVLTPQATRHHTYTLDYLGLLISCIT